MSRVILHNISTYDLVGTPSFREAKMIEGTQRKSPKELKVLYESLYVHKHIPYSIRRRDGEILLLNNDFSTYSFKRDKVVHSEYGKYTYRRLFEDDRINEGDFEVEGWAPINNLFEQPHKYFKGTQLICNFIKPLNK